MSTSYDFSDCADMSHLQAAAVSFDALTSEPRLLSLDCTAIQRRYGVDLGLPAGLVLLSDLRVWLLAHAGDYAAVNAVWQEIAVRARQDREWMTVALGMAMPRLVRQAGTLARGFRGDPYDIDAAMVVGFLEALTDKGLDVTAPGLHIKLCWAAYRAAHDLRYADVDLEYRDDLDNEPAEPHRPYNHVDMLFLRGIALGIVDADEVELIISTRIDRLPITDHAELTGERVATLERRRTRAGLRLAGGLAAGHLSGLVSEQARRELAARAARRRALRRPLPGAA